MSDGMLDEQLKERFAHLREEDAARAPDFRAMMEEARAEEAVADVLPLPTPRRARRWPLLAGALAAAVLAGVILRSPDADDEFDALVSAYASDLGPGAWRSPTDALLKVPGHQILSGVPSIGVGLDLFTDGEETRSPGNEG